MAMRALTFGLCLYLAIAGVSAQDAGAKAAAEFKQCGGSTNCNGHPNCGDAPWSDVKCSTGYVCSRQNAFYWQCTNDPAALTAAGVAPAAAAPVLAGPAAPLPVAAPLAAPAEVFTTPRTGGAQQPLPPILAETVITPNSVPATAVPAQTAPAAVAPAADPMATTVATQLPSAPVVEPPAPPRPQYPGIKPAGPRNETAPATLACACIDIGLNDPACFKGVTDYCEAAEFKPNMTVCESMSGFFNNQNVTAARIVSDFLIDSCRVAVPPTATACACLEGPNSDGCKAATLNACHIGSPICAALAFGSEASDKSQESLQALIEQNCGSASSTSDIAMSFPGISKEEFNARYAKGTVAALAAVTKQPETAISMVALREVVSASGGKGSQTMGAAQAGAAVPAGRKLLEASPKNLMIKYQIKCSPKDTMEVNKRLHAASANDGEGLYDALSAHGVPLRPSFSVNGGQMVSSSSSAHKKAHGLKGAAIAGVVIGVLAALALIGAGVAGVIMMLRKRSDAAGGADGADAAEKGKSNGGAKVFDLTAESTIGAVSTSDEKRAAKAAAEAERRAAKAAADAEAAARKAAADAEKKAAKEAAEAEAAAKKAAKEAAEAEKKAARQAEIAAKKAAAEAEAAAKRAAAAAEAEAAAKKAAEHAAAKKEAEEAARKAAQELAAQKAAEAAAAKKAAEELASKKATEAAAAKKAADELAAKKTADAAAAKKAAEEAAAAAAKKASDEAAVAAAEATAAAEAAAPEAATAKPRRKAMFSLSPTGWTARE